MNIDPDVRIIRKSVSEKKHCLNYLKFRKISDKDPLNETWSFLNAVCCNFTQIAKY